MTRQVTSTNNRHTRRRRALQDVPRLDGTQLSQDQIASIEARIIEHPNGCWLWAGSVDPTGYPQVVWKCRRYRVHRLYFEARSGAALPQELEVDHVCRNRRCCNPAHLEAVTHAENVRRIRARGAVALAFAWRSARDAALNLAHLQAITNEGEA